MVVAWTWLAAFAATTTHAAVFPEPDCYHAGLFTLSVSVEIDLAVDKTLERVELIE
jgi:hypothetical protein